MNNVVVKAADKGSGQTILEFFNSKGVFTGGYTGVASEENGWSTCYYGVIDGKFGNYYLEQVSLSGAVITTLAELKAGEVASVLDKEELSFPRTMIVWDKGDGQDKQVRTVIANIDGQYIAIPMDLTYEEYKLKLSKGIRVSVISWLHGTEITEPVKLTRASIADMFGITGDFEIID